MAGQAPPTYCNCFELVLGKFVVTWQIFLYSYCYNILKDQNSIHETKIIKVNLMLVANMTCEKKVLEI